MPVRTNMQPLIDYLRREGNASEIDIYEDVTYWTDEQLQDILDTISERKVAPMKLVSVDGLIYKLGTPRHYYADPDTVVLLDADLSAVTASYTYSLLKNEYTFTSDPEISYLQASFIHFWDATAKLWELKAAHRFQYVDNRAGQNFLKSHQEYDHCIERMEYYRNKTVRRWQK
jgi:hypothetical protein